MAVPSVPITPGEAPLEGPTLADRLAIDHPAGWWPTTARLKSYEAAGFRRLQVRMPPRSLLAEPEQVLVHATALRDTLRLTDLHLILHAPDDLRVGTDEHDRQFNSAITYAALAGAELVVYHGANFELGTPDLHGRLADEERSLRRLLRRAAQLGIQVAVENLAPVYPAPERVCHNPAAVAELVRRLDSEHVGMCLDLGHAHIAAGLARCDLPELIEPLLSEVIVFHVHDNYGAGMQAPRAGGVEPVRLDLHLAPGAGTVPWRALAPVIRAHSAALVLEVHPPRRPESSTLAIVMREMLAAGPVTA
jgi:sugar phosphate isomerase/epimerase